MSRYDRNPSSSYSASSSSGFRFPIKFIIAILFALFAIGGYWFTRSTNPSTGETQHVSLTPQQEIMLGLQATPEIAAQFGGLDSDQAAQRLVDIVGDRLVYEIYKSLGRDSPYEYEFHLLGDRETVNAFALPGGQIFITRALFDRFDTEGQLAGVLGHEIGHVIERHSAEQIEKQKLMQGLTGAAVIATYDPENPTSQGAAAMAMIIGNLITMKFGREDEHESDIWGVKTLAQAGYDPRAMVRVMEILNEASGGGAPPEFLSTHPNPENRIEKIRAAIAEVFPDGVPDGLIE